MRTYIVRRGDYLTELAHRLGFDAEVVWNHATNAGLRGLRTNPNMLAPGDVLHVPTDETPQPMRVLPRTTNRFVATVPKVSVSVVLRAGTLIGMGAKVTALGRKPG